MNLKDSDSKPGLTAGRVALVLSAGGAGARRRASLPVASPALNITVFDSFAAARGAWLRFEPRADAYAFQCFEWLKPWYDFIGAPAGVTPCIALVEQGGEPLMLLPLAIERRAGIRCLVWMGGRVCDYRAPLLARDFSRRVDAQRFRALWRQLRGRLPPHDAIALESQPAFVGSQPNPFRGLRHDPHVTDAYFTFLGPSLDAFLRSKRSGHWFRDERRKERRMRQLGGIDYEITTEPDAAARLLPEFMAQKSHSYRELGTPDLFAEPGHREFFEYVTRRGVRDGFVHLSGLRVDGQVRATHWGLVYRGRFYCLFPTYARDEAARHSPGNALMRRLFEWCIANGVEVFDFTIGDEPYKYDWCDQRLGMFDSIEATKPRGGPYVAGLRLARAVKRGILSSPLRGHARALRVWVHKQRQR